MADQILNLVTRYGAPILSAASFAGAIYFAFLVFQALRKRLVWAYPEGGTPVLYSKDTKPTQYWAVLAVLSALALASLWVAIDVLMAPP